MGFFSLHLLRASQVSCAFIFSVLPVCAPLYLSGTELGITFPKFTYPHFTWVVKLHNTDNLPQRSGRRDKEKDHKTNAIFGTVSLPRATTNDSQNLFILIQITKPQRTQILKAVYSEIPRYKHFWHWTGLQNISRP